MQDKPPGLPIPKTKFTKIIAVLIGIVAIGALLLVERSLRLNRAIPEHSEGQVLPKDSKLQNVFTKETVGFEKFKGKVILINFWASWCEACMAEMPSIGKLYNLLKDQGFEVVSINVDDNPQKIVPAIMQKLNLNFQVYVDATGVLSQSFDVVAIPFSIVADRQQKVVWIESGERDWASDAILEKMRKLLTAN